MHDSFRRFQALSLKTSRSPGGHLDSKKLYCIHARSVCLARPVSIRATFSKPPRRSPMKIRGGSTLASDGAVWDDLRRCACKEF